MNLHISIHGHFWISVYWNMEIVKYEQFCLTIHKDFWISVFKPQRFLNLHVLKHRDSKISRFGNTGNKFYLKKYILPILKLLYLEERKLNLLRKNFNNMPLHTLVIDFLREKKLENQTFFLYPLVLYTEIFTLKAYNSAKSNRWQTYFRMWIKGPGTTDLF